MTAASANTVGTHYWTYTARAMLNQYLVDKYSDVYILVDILYILSKTTPRTFIKIYIKYQKLTLLTLLAFTCKQLV